jgi:hypothetical protein
MASKNGDNKDEYAKAQALFNQLKEKNGNLPVPRLSEYLKQQGMDDSWVQKAMQQIDVNGDNELSWAEFATKGIRIVHHLKLHADHVAKQAKQGKSEAPKPAAAPAASSQGGAKKAAASASTPASTAASTSSALQNAHQDLVPLPSPRSRNIAFVWRQRTKAETSKLIQDEAANKNATANANTKHKKKFKPTKPTKDEKGVLHRLKKHDATKAPAYEKSLNEKYSIKKAAAPKKK